MAAEETVLASEDDALAWLDMPRGTSRYAALDLLARRNIVVPIIGAGVSVGANLPSGPAIAAEMRGWPEAAQLDVSVLSSDDPRAVADAYVEGGVLEPEEVSRRVVAYLEEAAGTPSATVELLARVPSRLVVTLNYDLTLERAADAQGIEYESLVLARDSERVLEVASTRIERTRLAIVHLHGSVEEPLSVVLDSLAYSRLANSYVFDRFFERLLAGFVLLFVGTRLDEQLITVALLRGRTGGAPNLFVGDAAACDELTRPPAALTEASHLLVIREYDDHEQLVPLFELIVAPVREEPVPAEPRVAQHVPPQEPLAYVAPQLVPGHESGDAFYSAYLVAAGEQQPFSEDDLRARGARTVVVGAPGSGKTTLMRRIGLGHSADVRPVLVRLADVPHVGEPGPLLQEWARRGDGLRGEEEVNPEALAQRTFHFFLDGLDELPRGRQDAMADKLVRVAHAHPEHMFTVASRDVPALDQFVRPEWQHVSLLLGAEWQAEFLARFGLTWDELVRELPALADARPLLDLPFFLAEVVRLHEKGELAAARDLGGVLSALIDAALKESGFPADTAAVREWLRAVALTFLLSERRDATVDELARIPMPTGLADAGTAEEVAEGLVAARVFAPSRSGRYGFVHRLIGEVLAGEALLVHPPADHGLIDAAAPSVGDDLRGARSDWVVPLAFAAARSEVWRKALRDRDPLAAARAVPNDATVEEREQAARVIWETYSNWRIWIWEYGRPSLVEDGDSLARLLLTDGLEHLRNEIVAAGLDPETPREIRGNAFRVLSVIGERAIASGLRAVLEDSAEDSVLRRVAGRAAATLDLESLFYIVAHRATHPAGDAEAQDMSYYALDLADDRELFSLALRLFEAPGAKAYILLPKLRQTLSPVDELALLRRWASTRDEPLETDRGRLAELAAALPRMPGAIESAAYVTAAWRLQDDRVRHYLQQHALSAVRGMVAAVADGFVYDYELMPYLEWFSEDDLASGGASDMLLEWKRRQAA